MSDKNIISELLILEAGAEMIRQSCFNLRKKLEGESSLSNARKGEVLDPVLREKLRAERRAKMFKTS
jgi:hypothetical protein